MMIPAETPVSQLTIGQLRADIGAHIKRTMHEEVKVIINPDDMIPEEEAMAMLDRWSHRTLYRLVMAGDISGTIGTRGKPSTYSRKSIIAYKQSQLKIVA